SEVRTVFTRQLSERRQYLAHVRFYVFEAAEIRRHRTQIVTDALQADPRQVRADIVDHQSSDRCSRQTGQCDADQASYRGPDQVQLPGTETRNDRIDVGAVLRERVLVGIP